jgi:hypothetical protein
MCTIQNLLTNFPQVARITPEDTETQDKRGNVAGLHILQQVCV